MEYNNGITLGMIIVIGVLVALFVAVEHECQIENQVDDCSWQRSPFIPSQ